MHEYTPEEREAICAKADLVHANWKAKQELEAQQKREAQEAQDAWVDGRVKVLLDGMIDRQGKWVERFAGEVLQLRKQVDALRDTAGEIMGQAIAWERQSMREHVAKEVGQLREEIASLKCDLEIVRQHNVAPFSRGRDAA
jgi:hypothetical protein